MKQITRFFCAIALLAAMAAPAFATDFRVWGEMEFAFEKGFFNDNGRVHSDFHGRQQVRAYMEMAVSESLRGMLAIEIGEANWGNWGEDPGDGSHGQGFSIGGDGVNIETRWLYFDWTVPDAELWVRAGLQPIALPGAVAGSPILDDDMAGIAMHYDFTSLIGATLFWARLQDNDDGNMFQADAGPNDTVDAFGLSIPIVFDGASVSPYGMYMTAGQNADFLDASPTDDVNAWWAGVAVEYNIFDPLAVKFDAIYGNADSDDADYDSSGFFLSAAVEYQLERFTPGLFAFYGSGADSDGDGWMPTISPTGFGPTTFGTDGAFGINSGAALTTSGIGLWGVGLRLADISFIDKLSHTVRVVYYRGANHKSQTEGYGDGEFYALTDKDWAWEINLDSTCEIDENLTAVLELGYIGVHYKDNQYSWAARSDMDGAWKIGLGMVFRF